MIHRPTRVIALTILLAVAAGLLFTTAASAQEQNSVIEDGEIVQCGMITENGHYEIADSFEHDGSNVCLNVTAESVTIDGGTMQGDRDSSTAIKASGPYDGQITLRDVTLLHWGETVFDNKWGGQKFVVENGEFDTNTQILKGSEGGGLEMSDSEVRNTYSTAIFGDRLGQIIIHDSTFTGGGGPVIGTMDGAGVEVRGSEITNHDGNAFSFGHSTGAEIHNTDIRNNGGSGIYATSSTMGISVEVYDSIITNNDGHGINAYPFGGPATLHVENTEIDDNGGLAIRSNVDDDVRSDDAMSASNLDLGGGLVVDFEDISVDLSTEAAHDHDTDALVFEVPDDIDAEMTAHFDAGGSEVELWAKVDGEWEQRETYNGGTLTEVVGPGTWAASNRPQETNTPTDTPIDESDPTPTDEPEQTDTTTDTPTDTDSDLGGSGSEPSTETRTPSNSQPTVEPEPRTTRTYTDVPSDPTSDTETETTTDETATENETEMPATDDQTETTTTDDTTSSGDGGSPWGWYGIAVAIVLLMATLTASLVSWE